MAAALTIDRAKFVARIAQVLAKTKARAARPRFVFLR